MALKLYFMKCLEKKKISQCILPFRYLRAMLITLTLEYFDFAFQIFSRHFYEFFQVFQLKTWLSLRHSRMLQWYKTSNTKIIHLLLSVNRTKALCNYKVIASQVLHFECIHVYNKSVSSDIKKETLAQVFSCKFWEISKNTFFYRIPPMAASVSSNTLTKDSFTQISNCFLRSYRLPSIG